MPEATRSPLRTWATWLTVIGLVWLALPDVALDPYGAFNPHAIAEFVFIILCISGLGQLSMQRLGPHNGLLLTAGIGGFASSTATIYAMGQWARQQPGVHTTAVSAALVSSASTALQLLVLTQLLAPALAPLTRLPVALGLLVLLGFALYTWRHRLAATDTSVPTVQPAGMDGKALIGLTLLVCAISGVSGWLFARVGSASLPLVAAISGLADAHALIPALGALLHQGRLAPNDAVTPVFLALTVNAISKSLVAWQSGGRRFGAQVFAGLAVSMVGVWLGVGFDGLHASPT